jgi:hypothetical protein
MEPAHCAEVTIVVFTFNQLPATRLLGVHVSILKATFLSYLSFIATAREGYS